MVREWHIVISGFRQSLAQPTGSERLWLDLRSASKPGTCIQAQQWDDDWQGLANRIRRCSVATPTIRVYAYSWGAGHGFIALANACRTLGLNIADAVLCDPVYRSTLLPTWLTINPLSLMRTPTIKVPDNVRHVHWLRQRKDLPAGHDVVPADPRKTIVFKPTLLAIGHSQMDNSDEYHTLAKSIAGVTP
jgi:hypothetical protein